MNDSTRQMIADAYAETVSEALSSGQPGEVAHREGLTAAAMFLSAMTGLEDNAALAEVGALGLVVS